MFSAVFHGRKSGVEGIIEESSDLIHESHQIPTPNLHKQVDSIFPAPIYFLENTGLMGRQTRRNLGAGTETVPE